MVHPYQGHYQYDEDIVSNWESSAIGVYYCGYLTEKGLWPLYIGKGTSETGMRGRLLDHLGKEYWSDVTHFGYHLCDTVSEAEKWEIEEIVKYKPKYNIQGK